MEVTTMRNRRRRRGARGFTLLEVLLVITIIGILAAFVVPRMIGVGDRAKIDIAQSAVGKSGPIALALDVFYQKMGRYPTTDENLAVLHDKDKLNDEEEQKRWVELVEPDTLKDPWGEDYQYRGPEDAQFNQGKYDLYSKGPDKKEDTEDDIGNWVKEK
jgi:general secretion pathway protein G